MRHTEILEACWQGYRQAGMKKKGDRQVPNCVPVAEVKTGPEITGKDLLFKAAAMAMRDAGREGIDLDYEQAIKQASKIYGIPYTPSELPKLLAQRAEIDRQLALLKQGKQVAKQRRQEKLAPTPAGAEEYWRTHALPTDRIKPPAKTLEAVDPFLDNTARELLGLVIIAGGAFAVGTYYTIVNKLKKYQGRQIIDALERKGVRFNRETYERVQPLLDQFRQALKDDEGEQAKMLAKRIEQMIVMGKLSAPEPQSADTALAAKEKELAEDLKKWFKEKWVRFGPDGKIRGDCARGDDSEGKPKCLPQSKAHALGKKGRASAAAKKRREDPNAERRGPAKNVATKVREGVPQETIRRYLAIDAETDVEAVRAAIQAISKDPVLSDSQKSRYLGYIFALVSKHRLLIGRPYYQFLQRFMEDINETALNPQDPQGDYEAKRRALHDLSLNKDVDQQAVQQRRLDLDREARAKGLAETVTNVKAGMAEIYRRLAPKIERHRDSFLAGQLYDELENYAELHGAEGEFKRMMATARGRAHMEYDTNPGGFHNWFWFLPFEDEQVEESIDDIKKKMSKLEALALAANRAGDDAKCKMYQQKIQSLKQKLSQSMAEGWSDRYNPTLYSVYIDGREWKAFKDDEHARAVAKKVEANLQRQGRKQTVTIAPSKTKKVQEAREIKTQEDFKKERDRLLRMIDQDTNPANKQILRSTIRQLENRAEQEGWITAQQRLMRETDSTILSTLKQVDEEQDACYRKVKSRYKVWPSAYASGALVQCRKKGAANWGNKGKK